MNTLKDVQSEKDWRNVYLHRVGIRNLDYPVTVMDRANGYQDTVAKISMYVDLPVEYRGTHMSRFVEVLNRYRLGIDPQIIKDMLEEMRIILRAEIATVEIEFPYFILKNAPISHQKSFLKYLCRFEAHKTADTYDFVTSVKIPVTTLCPCSKEISDRGAHNQRANIWIHVRYKKLVWLEELIDIAENSASSPVYSLLKRPDEKFLTEFAYDHPRFVEDVAREVALKLNHDERILWYKVEVESFESIHDHNAYACVMKNMGGV